MLGNIPFTQRAWRQLGVNYIIKNIPNDPRTGVLEPEVLRAIKNGQKGITAQSIKAMKSMEHSNPLTSRSPPQIGCDLTTEPIRQWDFSVSRNGYDINVTACCLARVAEIMKPAVVYFHGGGWRTGSRADVQNALRLLAQLSGAVIFNVEYRLAPQYKYPCGTDDCWWVLKYVYANAAELGVDGQSITVSGDSVGGTIAAVCSRRDRNMRTRMIAQQVLIYPMVAHIDPVGEADYSFFLNDYEFDDSQAKWIVPSINTTYHALQGMMVYLNHTAQAASPDVSPLFDKSFGALPKTLIICGEYDYLTQQCRTYANRLAQGGVDTTFMVYRGTTHGFMNHVGQYPQSADLLTEFAAAIRQL